ncbi:MAG: acetylgalactosaminidase [Euryarchaeota archaeon]|nr:acetylgalactosaminidase [Euryarchaeota archaeon]|tara:strand:+ start:762 stop:2165 length:1404 start_codon:yes stop_codon:yes gene_type:complete
MRRKDFLRLSALFGGGLFSGATLGQTPTADLDELANNTGIDGSMFNYADAPIKKVRVAVVGLGNRGTTLIEMLNWLVRNEHCEIVAICDVQKRYLDRASERIAKFQSKSPLVVDGSSDKNAWQQMCNPELADLLLIATPWRWHAPMAKYAMEQGLHTATEVPMAYEAQDSLDLIKTAEQTKRHCIMIENCCYNGEELFVLNMVKEGVFGDLTHAECAYIHDLRELMLHTDYYHERWRLNHHLERDGNFYTTHGLGPVCMYMDILRGDNLSHLVSMSSNEAALSKALRESDDPVMNAVSEKVKCGDVNTTLIKTEKGRSIMLQFDVHTGRPYNRLNKLCGTGAVHYGYPSRLFIDDPESGGWHSWQDETGYKEHLEKYAHPMWVKLREQISDNEQGHGGMDFVMMYRLIRALNHGVPLDLNVYDGALWSIVGALTDKSVALGNQRVNIPDITNGMWKNEAEHPVFREL